MSKVYQLTIRPLPDSTDPDGIRRLRWALKTLLRGYRLRTIYIREVEGDGRGAAGPGGPVGIPEPPAG